LTHRDSIASRTMTMMQRRDAADAHSTINSSIRSVHYRRLYFETIGTKRRNNYC
jgi:hypothetical protein